MAAAEDGGADGRKGKKRTCILCGCADHRLVGCHRHAARRCSCFGGAQRAGG